MQVKYSTIASEKAVRTIKRLSEKTRIPQSKLFEEAIRLLEAQHASDIVTSEFRRVVDEVVKEDLPALRRLAQ